MLKLLPVVGLILYSSSLMAQECATDCKSQLLRVEVSSSVLNQGNAQSILPSLKTLSESPSLHAAIESKFPLRSLDFPPSTEKCLREKNEGSPAFRNITCEDPTLCTNTSLNPDVRDKICFKLPCTLFEGSLNVGKCSQVKDLYPVGIGFPDPVDIKKFDLTPTSVDFKDNQAKLCFRVNNFEASMSASLTFDTTGTQLPDRTIEVRNVTPKLDSPKNVCVTADVRIGTSDPISNIQITNPDNVPFISDDMIRDISTRLDIRGISGYPADDLKAVQNEVVPVLAQPLRDTVEKAVRESLAKAFENQLKTFISPPSSKVDTASFMSELGINNMQVYNQLSKLECATIKATRQPIPEKHACIGLDSYGAKITPEWTSPSINELLALHSLVKDKNITSENVKNRLIALKEVMLQEKQDPFFDTPDVARMEELQKFHTEDMQDRIKKYIDPMIDEISNNQMRSQIYSFVEIQNQIRDGRSNTIGLTVPEICSQTPSPHAGRSMRNCPVQVYADLNEFNIILKQLWQNGRMCMKGSGEYKPKRDEYGGQSYTIDGEPLAESGCYMNFSGMGCYLKEPPQIKFDRVTKKYKVALKLDDCYRGPVMFGLGKIGGDLNIDFAFAPKACENGDFCVENPDINWQVVPGTERFALRPSSFLHDIVTDTMNNALTNVMKDSLRLPMASSAGSLGVPLQAEGRVDSGPGFFGVCLEIPSGSSQQ